MPLDNKNKGLRDLLKAKGASPKDASGSQRPFTLPLPPLPPVNVFAPAGLKKRNNDKEGIEEEELVP